jgi:hypothetical protein
LSEPREIHQVEYRWHPVKDLFPVASSMSPESTRGWDIRMRAWVRHPPVDAPSQSVCYQVLPPNGAVAALAWRSRQQQAGREGGRPHVSRVLVGNTSLLTPEVAIALCRMGLPVLAGERPGQVVAGAELPTVGAAELVALAGDAVEWLDREAREAAADDGLTEVIAAAIAEPNAPLAIGLPEPAVSRPPGDGPQARLLWGLWRITRPLLGTVRRGWSFSTFEVPQGAGDPSALADIVFRAGAAVPPGPASGTRKEARAVPGNPGALEGSPQAWLAEWLVAEYTEGGGDAVERLIAQCGVEQQPLQARLAAVYDQLHAKWARTTPAAQSARQPSREPAQQVAATASGQAEPGPGPGVDPELAEPGRRRVPEAQVVEELELAAPEPGLAAAPQARAGSRLAARPGGLGPLTREGTPPPLPMRDRATGEPGLLAQGSEPVPPRLFEPGLARSAPDLLIRLIGTQDSAEFKLLLQDVLTLSVESELGNRVDARRMLFEARWCTDASRPADRQLHADELARIFSVIVLPDLDRPRVAREIAEWAAMAPAPVIGGLLAAARGESRAERTGWEKYQAMMSLLQLPLAQRWAADNGLRAEWDPSLAARSRRDAGRGFLGFRKRGPAG